ncbi:hypothetical protein BB559_001390 [Furculomyces boomerangus]|uniref:RGS domain-containing protein n=1 Tax=Furculomyces boomerangus TaxID=61424 RepID=A0A2T9Z258_9FUNG|nr:hypothetical protein BB559_001390 [Furculomyces boomerangus]
MKFVNKKIFPFFFFVTYVLSISINNPDTPGNLYTSSQNEPEVSPRRKEISEAKLEELKNINKEDLTPEQKEALIEKKKMKPILVIYEKVKIPKRIYWFISMGIWVVFSFVTTTVYLKKSANTQEFKFKSKTMTLVVAGTGLVFVVHAMTTEALVPYYPCFLRVWIGYISLFLFSVSLIVRAVNYISQVRMLRFKSEISLILTQAETVQNDNEKPRLCKTYMDKGVIKRFFRLIVNSQYSEDIDDKQAELQFRLTINNRVLDFLRPRNYIIVCLATLIFAISISAYFTTYENYHIIPVSYNCKTGISTPIIPLYTLLLLLVLISIPLIFLCFGFTDAFGMQIELLVTMTMVVVLATAMILYNELAPPTVLMYATGYVFIMPVFFMQQFFLIAYPLYKIYKIGGHSLSGGSADRSGVAVSTRKEQFKGLLAYPAGFTRLSQAALETFCPENIEFLKDYQLLKFKVCSLVVSDTNNSNVPEDNRKNGMMKTEISESAFNINHFDEEKDIAKHNSMFMETIDPDFAPEVDMNQLIGGELVPPLPITTPEAMYQTGLMLDLHLINDTEGKKERTTPKMTLIPNKLKDDFWKFYVKFIQEEALLAVNVPVKVSAPIEAAIKNEKYTLGMYDEALDEVLNSLYTNTYPIMLKTL